MCCWGLFFVTIGMLLDMRVVVENGWASVLLITLVVLKTAADFRPELAVRQPFGRGAAHRAGVWAPAANSVSCCWRMPHKLGLIDRQILQPVLAAMVLSMLIAPFIIEHSEHIVRRWSAAEWMTRAMQLHNIAVQSMAADQHVVICGYGRSGQNLARLLEQENVPFIALDLDPQRISEAAAAGESVVFGDAARREVLVAAGLMRAQGGGDHLCRHRIGAAHSRPRAGTASRTAGDRAHARRHRYRPPARRRRRGSGGRDHGRQPDARFAAR